MHISLARKYRPRTFADVAVQSHVSNTLKGAIARGRVAHGYLLCGPRGVGKTTLARVLAMALNCERRSESGEPCGECTSCMRIWSGSASLDVVEIDAASNRGVDDARELRERAMYAPSGDEQYKVYIVDEAHMLTREAWNALLKILEEPPPRVVFVFATTEPQKIAQAAAPVLSRLQRFDFKRIGPADIRRRLEEVLAAEQVDATADAVALIARAADGSMRDALSLADQALSLGAGSLTAERVRESLGLVAEDEYLAILDLVAEGRAADIFPAVGRLVDAGIDLGAFLGGLTDMLRAQLAITLGAPMPDLSERSHDALTERVGRLSAGDLLRMLNMVTELEPHFRRSGQQQVLLESLLVRFALMDRTVSLEEVLQGLGQASGVGRVPARGRMASGTAEGRSPTPTRRPPSDATHPQAGARTMSDAQRHSPTPGHAPDAGRSTPADAGPPTSDAQVSPTPDARRPIPDARRPTPDALSLNPLVERWGDVAARVRADGRGLLAAALDAAMPVGVSARGDITLELDNDLHEQAITSGEEYILAAIRSFFTGATRLMVRVGSGGAVSDGAPRRLTEEQVKEQRLDTLRKRDPILDAAVEALDLELLE